MHNPESRPSKKSDEKIDERAFGRIHRSFIMRVAVDDGGPWPRWSLVTTHNLSAGGALFTFDQPVKVGDRLSINIHFLDYEIDCKGRVIRFEPAYREPLCHLAVLFEGLGTVEKEAIQKVSAQVNERRRGFRK